MADAKTFLARRTRAPAGMPPRPTASPSGNVVAVDTTGIPSIPTPTNFDIMHAIAEVTKKIQQLSKNQQVIEAKLNHITTRLAAVDANLITGVHFLKDVSWSIGWWVTGDTNTAESTWPSEPHLQ